MRTSDKAVTGALALAMLGAIAIACGSDGANGAAGTAGTPGTAGAAGQNGTNGTNGANGGAGTAGTNGANGAPGTNGGNGEAGAPGGTIVISARAKHGLDISPVPLAIAGLTGAQIEAIGQGSYIVNAIADCAGCHNSPDATPKFLAGGNAFPVGPTNTVVARNLTPDATTGLQLTEAQFIEVLRTGMDFKNTPDGGTAVALQFMPWPTFRWMSTDDMRAIYAYLKAIPAQNNAVGLDNKVASAPVAFTAQYTDGQVTRTLPPEVDGQGGPIPDPNNVLRGLAVDAVNDDPATAGLSPSDLGMFGRGAYLVNAIADCTGCHTNPDRTGGKVNFAQFLTGGQVFPTPGPLQPLLRTTRVMSANLSGPTGFFSRVGLPIFLEAITQGVHADDPPPQAPLGFPMPARVFRNMTIDDLESVYLYMRQVATQVPGRTDKAIRESAKYCALTSDCDTANGETCSAAGSECVARNCAADADCPVCQACTGGTNNKCALLTGGALGGCIGAGL